MNRSFWTTKTFWAAVSGTLLLAGTCYAFAIDAHPVVKATFAFMTGMCGILEAAFVASRVSAEAKETRAAVTGTGNGNVNVPPQPTQLSLICKGCGHDVAGEPSTIDGGTGNIYCQKCKPIPPEMLEEPKP